MRLEYKTLSTGYHHVRDAEAHHLFAQWPVGSACKAEDVSGIPLSISCAEFAEKAQRIADKKSERLRAMSAAVIDAKLLGAGFLMILADNSIQHIPADAVSIDTSKLSEGALAAAATCFP